MKKYNSCLYDCVDRALKDCNNHQERNVINIYPTGWREEVCVVYYTRTDALKQEWKPSDEQITNAAREWIYNHKEGDKLYVKDAFVAGAKWVIGQLKAL